MLFLFSLTCQAGTDEDRKGFCAVYSSLIRVAGAANNWPIGDTDMEKAEKKCLNTCKKNRKGDNSHKEARKILCKAYGLKSFNMTKVLGLWLIMLLNKITIPLKIFRM